MRNIHAHIISEYGKESVKIFSLLEKIEMKMADFKNKEDSHSDVLVRILPESLLNLRAM